VATLSATLLLVGAPVGASGTSTHGHHHTASSGLATSAGARPAVVAGLLPWSLPQPLSREVALPGAPGSIDVLGGLTASSASSASVTALAVPSGSATAQGQLAAPTHDAAGAVIGGRSFLFGGGDQTTVATVQAYGGPAGGSATTVAQLPQPRSDAVAATIKQTTYVVGGYDGTRPDPAVLATTSGTSFTTVANLPVPVRYPAVAALGSTLYVFGGEAVTGPDAGKPVTTIQAVNVARGTASTVGQLPEPLAGSAAVTLDGVIYLAGGETTDITAATTWPSDGDTGVTPTGASSAGTASVATIWAFNPRGASLAVAGTLQVPVANAGLAVSGGTAWLLGGETNGRPVSAAQMFRPDPAYGLAGEPGAGSPYYGDQLLIADRGNNRLLVLNDAGAITWQYPNATAPPPPGPKGFYFPDDAFFIRHGTAIISNQEENDTIVQIGYPSGKVLWTTGHPAVPGSAPGYLHEPDDAYLLKDGNISVADSDNCRILILDPTGAIVHQVGTTGVCTHQPGTALANPNGDTPLANGDVLISETTGSYLSEYTQSGQLVWSTHIPIAYPSDPQPLANGLFLMTDYTDPGGIIEASQQGQIVYQYRDPSGLGELNQPSLAALLPSGAIMANDDYRDRMVAIDPVTDAVVWNYGTPDHPGTAPGLLNIPDGFDILGPNGSTPLHPQTG